MPQKNWKMALFWIMGSICLMMGSMIVGGLGDYSGLGYIINMAFSLMLFMLGGLLWIAVSISMKRKMD